MLPIAIPLLTTWVLLDSEADPAMDKAVARVMLSANGLRNRTRANEGMINQIAIRRVLLVLARVESLIKTQIRPSRTIQELVSQVEMPKKGGPW